MYTQQIGLTERIAIVDDLIHLAHDEKRTNQIIVPDNKAEIFIPVEGDVDFKCLGSVRSLSLREGNGYFCMPRRRGVEIHLTPTSKCLLIKINPIYAKKIASRLEEVSNGIFELNLSFLQKKDLYRAWRHRDMYAASDVIEEVIEACVDLYEYNNTILDSIEQIRITCGKTSVKNIYSSLNVSKSKLEQHFNREVGLTPKEFCKIEKINCFINSYLEDPNQSLTELTYQCGYYDQSHLIKDFKYFLDTSPKKFFAV